MVLESRPPGKPKPGFILALAVALLVVGFGDGLAVGLQSRLGLPSPWILLFGLLGFLLPSYMVLTGQTLARADVWRAGVIFWCFAAGLAVQFLVHDKLYVYGYVQLGVFVMTLALVRGVFAHADMRLLSGLGPAILVAHLFMSGYASVSWAMWHLTGMDLSVRQLIAPTSGALTSAYYGYRPSAWSSEPSWAGFALSISFIGVYYLVPRARFAALLAMGVAALALQSGTLWVFVVAAAAATFLVHPWMRVVVIAIAAALISGLVLIGGLGVTGTPMYQRAEVVAQGRDPSVRMRTVSVTVAAPVVWGSFPIGVGYGNFRDQAVYGPEWSQFLDLTAFPSYKSDILLLNFVAELGVGGLVLLAYVFRLLGFGRFFLPTVLLVMLALFAGTIMMPALLVLAAARGRQDRLMGLPSESAVMASSVRDRRTARRRFVGEPWTSHEV